MGMYLGKRSDTSITLKLGKLSVKNAACHGGNCIDEGNVQIFFHCFFSFCLFLIAFLLLTFVHNSIQSDSILFDGIHSSILFDGIRSSSFFQMVFVLVVFFR